MPLRKKLVLEIIRLRPACERPGPTGTDQDEWFRGWRVSDDESDIAAVTQADCTRQVSTISGHSLAALRMSTSTMSSRSIAGGLSDGWGREMRIGCRLIASAEIGSSLLNCGRHPLLVLRQTTDRATEPA